VRAHNYWLMSLLTILALALEPVAQGSGVGPTTVRFDLYRGYLIVVRGSAGPLKALQFWIEGWRISFSWTNCPASWVV
jgi:hypothetical protein